MPAAYLGAHPEITLWLSQLLAQRLHGVTSYLVDLKAQFEDRSDHLGMVDDVLETLLHTQDEAFSPGSDSYDDPGSEASRASRRARRPAASAAGRGGRSRRR